MKTIAGTSNLFVEINLTTGEIVTFEVDERDRRDYLGGKGLGLKLLYERLEKRCDPLGADNWLAFTMGALMGSMAPCSGRFSVVTKSPLTGIMVHSACGGPFGMACKTAGFDGLLITGQAPSPVMVRIDDGGAAIEPADSLWGLSTDETQKQLNPEGRDGTLVIGPAGEHRVLFASAASGQRFFRRGGVGAVMGAKRLKALVARGGHHRIVPASPKRFVRAKKRAADYIRKNPVTAEEYRHFGTASHVAWCRDADLLPVNNFTGDQGLDVQGLTGRAMRQRYHSRPSSCRPCSILCGHRGVFEDGSSFQLPEYESIAMLGPNLGIFDSDTICALNDRCGQLGLDPISTGSVLAWCMEAAERGLIDTPLRFGDARGLDVALEDIAHRRGQGDAMADGTLRLSQRYGGSDFAMQVKGLEMPAYDPRGAWGMGLAYAVANRGACHLSAPTFIVEAALGLLKANTHRGKAHFVRFFENLHAAINSLVTCPHTVYAYALEPPLIKFTPTFLLRPIMQYLPRLAIGLIGVGVYAGLWRSVTGIGLNRWQMLKAGERIHVLERLMNVGEGISRKDDTLPERTLATGSATDAQHHALPLQAMLDGYYRLRGYDQQGIPTPKTLKRLGIENRWPEDNDPRMADFKMLAPRRRLLPRWFLSLVFWFFGRAIQAAARVDKAVRQIFEQMPEGFSFAFGVLPDGPSLVVGKDKGGRVRYLGADPSRRVIDLTLSVKSIEVAIKLFTLQEATITAIARDRLTVDGDISMACRVVRILDRVEIYLLPRFLALKAVRRYPTMPMRQKLVRRCLIYTRTLIGF